MPDRALLWLPAVLLAAFPFGSFAQETTGRLEGPVVDPTGKLVAESELGFFDRSRLCILPGRIARGDTRPSSETVEIVPARADLRDPEVAGRPAGALLAGSRTDLQERESEQAPPRAPEPSVARPRPPHPAEFRLGFGVFFIAGVDLWAGYLPKNSRLQFGYRYLHWTETAQVFGNPLGKTTETMHGPQVNYLFRPEKRDTWYLGASVLYWSSTQTEAEDGASDTDAVIAPYFGGGYTRRLGKHVYCNAAMFLSPVASIETDTGGASSETTMGFDIQLQLGASF